MLYSVRIIIKERLLSHVVTFGLVLCLDQEIRWKVELVSKLFGASKTLDWALSLMEMVIILPPQSSIPSRSQAASRNDSSIDVRYVRYVRYVSYIRIHISSYLILGSELKCLAFGPIPQDSFHLFSLLHLSSIFHHFPMTTVIASQFCPLQRRGASGYHFSSPILHSRLCTWKRLMFHVVHAMSIPLGPDLSPRLCLLGCREGHPALASFFSHVQLQHLASGPSGSGSRTKAFARAAFAWNKSPKSLLASELDRDTTDRSA